jgi:ribonuclease M5
LKIKEVIVVEGRDDVTAVKRAVDAELITTHGFGIREETFKLIEEAHKKCGVIVFTDPDHAGERIRERITKRIGDCKHAFLPREEATKGDNIGIENATPESIIEALSKVRTLKEDAPETFSKKDLIRNDLVGSSEASARRDALGKLLGIGYANAKQFLRRMNHYGVTRAEFEAAIKTLSERG